MWTKAQELAAQYQSSGTTGIGFAQFASTGQATPELWDNIEWVEQEARAGDETTAGWYEDMKRLRELLKAEGHEQRLSLDTLKGFASQWAYEHGWMVYEEIEEHIADWLMNEHTATVCDDDLEIIVGLLEDAELHFNTDD